MTASAAPTPARAPPAPAMADGSPFRGVAYLLASVLFFACSDAASKHLMETLPALQVTWMRFAVFVALVGPAALWTGRAAWRTRRPGIQVLRGLGVVGSSLLFILGLGSLPLAEATAIAFVSPLLVTALSVLVLGERVGPRRWAATLVGMAGVLVVVRPGTDAFDPAALLPFLAALLWAGALVATRRMGEIDHPLATMLYTALVGFAALSLVVPFSWTAPSGQDWLMGVLSGIAATLAQGLVVLAYRRGSASLLSPFTYSQMVWAALLGFAAFGTVPDGPTLIGAVFIVGSGLYTAHRERLGRSRLETAL